MLRLRDIMTTNVITVDPDVSIRQAMNLFTSRRISGAPVVAGNDVIGVISASDLVQFAATASRPLEDSDTAGMGFLISRSTTTPRRCCRIRMRKTTRLRCISRSRGTTTTRRSSGASRPPRLATGAYWTITPFRSDDAGACPRIGAGHSSARRRRVHAGSPDPPRARDGRADVDGPRQLERYHGRRSRWEAHVTDVRLRAQHASRRPGLVRSPPLMRFVRGVQKRGPPRVLRWRAPLLYAPSQLDYAPSTSRP